jgi:hypothetical protein
LARSFTFNSSPHSLLTEISFWVIYLSPTFPEIVLAKVTKCYQAVKSNGKYLYFIFDKSAAFDATDKFFLLETVYLFGFYTLWTKLVHLLVVINKMLVCSSYRGGIHCEIYICVYNISLLDSPPSLFSLILLQPLEQFQHVSEYKMHLPYLFSSTFFLCFSTSHWYIPFWNDLFCFPIHYF